MTFDITATGFSLANAKVCACASADAYTVKPVVISNIDNTGVTIEVLPEGCILIAFEGTKNVRQFITDAQAWRENIKGCHLHFGFYRTISEMMPRIQAALADLPNLPLVITGHSLGGALAQLAGYYLRAFGRQVHSVYTFGGSRVGDAAGVKLYGDLAKVTYRVTNGADIVPWCPGLLAGYRHTNTEFWMPSIGGMITNPAFIVAALGDLAELYREWKRGEAALLTDHFIQSYLNRLEKCS